MAPVLVLALWTIVVVRTLSLNATLRLRTLAVYLAAGVLLAATAVPLVERVADPYAKGLEGIGPVAVTVLAALRLLAVGAPVVAFLALRHVRAKISVADAFLIGFAVGLGFELSGLLFVLTGTSKIAGLRALPPFAVHITGSARSLQYAGMQYWLGLVALVSAAASRFLRIRWIAVVVAIGVSLLVVLDQAWALSAAITKPWAPVRLVAAILGHGAVLPLLAVLLLIAAELVEARAVQRATHRPPSHHRRDALGPLARGDVAAAAHAFDGWRLERQAALARLTANYRPGARDLASAAREAADAAADWTDESPHFGLRPGRSVPLVPTACAAVAVIVFLGLRHWTKKGLDNLWWNNPLVHNRVFSLPWSPVDMALIGAILWWFLRRGARDAAAVAGDGQAATQARDVVLQVALMAALIVTCHLHSATFAPWPSAVGTYEAKAPLGFDPNQIATLVLLVSAAFAGFAVLRRRRWLLLDVVDRRNVVVPNAAIEATALTLALVSVGVYGKLLTALHADHGGWLFNTFGPHDAGNSAAALIAGLIAGVIGLAAGVVVRYGGRRVSAFLTAEGEG